MSVSETDGSPESKPKFCVECGRLLAPDGKFCAGCGSAVVSNSRGTPNRVAPDRTTNKPMAVLAAILMGVPAAILLGIILGLIVGGGSFGAGVSEWTTIYGLVAFPFLFSGGARRPRMAIRNGLITVAFESFVFPLVALIFTGVVGSHTISRASSDAAIAGATLGSGLVGAVLVLIGIGVAVAVGVPCLVLYFVLKTPGADADLIA